MKALYKVVAFIILATLVLSACSAAPAAAPAEAESVEVVEEAAPADEATDEEESETADAPEVEEGFSWDQDYITEVPPIMMMDPYFEIFGQSQVAVPYYYETAVKLSGHSCGATSGAWTIAKKALEILYPNGEVPVRGQITVQAPGMEDEWFVGVFGEVITYITGASPKTGFIGAEFGQTNDLFVRQNKMVYSEEPTGQMPPQREWIFTRLDTGAQVGIKYNLVVITPVATPDRKAMGVKMAAGEATPEEAADYYVYWNDRAKFVFENEDMEGFFQVVVYQEASPTTADAIAAPSLRQS